MTTDRAGRSPFTAHARLHMREPRSSERPLDTATTSPAATRPSPKMLWDNCIDSTSRGPAAAGPLVVCLHHPYPNRLWKAIVHTMADKYPRPLMPGRHLPCQTSSLLTAC